MILIRPQTIDESALAASNIAEGDPGVWNVGTTYATGDKASIAAGSTLAIYKSLADDNIGNDPETAAQWWVEDGVTYLEYDSEAIYADADRVIDAAAHHIYESLFGGVRAEVTMTIASPCVVTWVAHGRAEASPILFTTDGVLPTGIEAGTVYYVKDATADAFNIAATVGGAAIGTSGSQSGTHTAIASPNKGHPLSNPDWWLDLGPTNKWAMFDDVVGTVTAHPYQIDVTMQLSGRVDSLALLNLVNAVVARVIVNDEIDGLLYDESFSLVSTEGVDDWHDYFFEEIEKKQTLLVRGLPTHAGPTMRVIIEGNGESDVECGVLSVGMAKSLGQTLHDGAQVGIIDYSRKDADQFGNHSIVERPYSKRGSFRLLLPKAAVDGVQKTLADFRASPAVYVAADDYGATLIFGFFREFNIEIAYPLESLCSIEIEGLT